MQLFGTLIAGLAAGGLAYVLTGDWNAALYAYALTVSGLVVIRRSDG